MGRGRLRLGVRVRADRHRLRPQHKQLAHRQCPSLPSSSVKGHTVRLDVRQRPPTAVPAPSQRSPTGRRSCSGATLRTVRVSESPVANTPTTLPSPAQHIQAPQAQPSSPTGLLRAERTASGLAGRQRAACSVQAAAPVRAAALHSASSIPLPSALHPAFFCAFALALAPASALHSASCVLLSSEIINLSPAAPRPTIPRPEASREGSRHVPPFPRPRETGAPLCSPYSLTGAARRAASPRVGGSRLRSDHTQHPDRR